MGPAIPRGVPGNSEPPFCRPIRSWKSTSKATERIKRRRSIGQSAYAGKTRVLRDLLEGARQIVPQGVRVLEPDAEAKQSGRHSLAFPAVPALHHARHA